nr:MAG TPA: Erm Leader peptide [Caudoviricetes sp.]
MNRLDELIEKIFSFFVINLLTNWIRCVSI